MNRNTLNAVMLVTISLVVIMALLNVGDQITRSGRTMGVMVDDDTGALIVIHVFPGSPAERGGLEAGDEILAVDGTPVETLNDLVLAAGKFKRGRKVEIVVLRSQFQRTVSLTPGMPVRWNRLLLDLFSILGYATIAFLARFRAPNVLPSRLLGFFTVAVALELALPQTVSFIPHWAIVHDALFYLLSGLQLALELHLASVIPRRYSWFDHRPWLPRLYYTIGLGIGAFTAAMTIAEGAGMNFAAGWSGAAQVAMNDFVLVGWGIAVVVILLVQLHNSRSPGHRSQALTILVGVIPWAVYNIANSVISHLGISVGPWFDFAQPIVLLFYPLVIFVAIFRYHLFDIRVVLKRSLVLLLVTIVVLMAFTAVFEAVSNRLGDFEQAGRFRIALFALTMLVLGILFNPLRKLIQTKIDQRFFPERIAQRTRLAELAANLPSLGSLAAIGRHVVEEVSRVFQVASATVFVLDPSSGLLLSLATASDRPVDDRDVSLLLEGNDAGVDQLRKARRPLPADIIASTSPPMAQRIALVGAETGIGLVAGETLVGLLFLGPKIDGTQLTTEEQDLLRLFSINLATVLENVRLFQSATYEQLTGLLRREAILEALEVELNRAGRYGRPLTVGMVDLDHFKDVNDTWGHLAGDALLQRVATELKSCLRTTDQIGRYGGEEFLFFLPETDLELGALVAEKLRASIERMPSPVADAPDLRITASIGIVELTAGTDPPPPVEDLIGAADSALLQGKETGRNRVVSGGSIPAAPFS